MLARGTRQGVDEGGFTCAIAPQQRQGLSLWQGHGHLIQHHGFAIARAKLMHLEQISHAELHGCRPAPSKRLSPGGRWQFGQGRLR